MWKDSNMVSLLCSWEFLYWSKLLNPSPKISRFFIIYKGFGTRDDRSVRNNACCKTMRSSVQSPRNHVQSHEVAMCASLSWARETQRQEHHWGLLVTYSGKQWAPGLPKRALNIHDWPLYMCAQYTCMHIIYTYTYIHAYLLTPKHTSKWETRSRQIDSLVGRQMLRGTMGKKQMWQKTKV